MKGKVVYGSRGETYFIDGIEVTKAEFDTTFPKKPLGVPMQAQNPACWPMKSDALACHPEQIPEMMERDRKRGIASEYDPKDGRMILKDRGQRRDIMRSLGFHDNNGSYGD
jgi:hypothetical protein